MVRALGVVVLCIASLALAADKPKAKAGGKGAGPKLDLGLGPTTPMGGLPMDKLEKPKEATADQQTRTSAASEPYTVLAVLHGKSFAKGPKGSAPAAPFPGLVVAGDPPTSERFSTVVRLRSPEKRNTSVEVAVLDVRGDTVMEASGQILFGNAEEAEWSVDWQPSWVKRKGPLQVLVRVGGNPLGTWPLPVVDAPEKK